MTLPGHSIRLAHTAQRWSDTSGPCTGCGTATHCLVAATGVRMCLPCQENDMAGQVADRMSRRAGR